MELRRKKVTSSIEEDILTGIIVSDSYCRNIEKILKKSYFKNPQIEKVAQWSIEYFKKYRKAPNKLIKDIFTVEKKNLSKEEIDVIKLLLMKLSSKYETGDQLNVDYLLDKTIPYFKKRVMEDAIENASALLELERVEEAEKEMNKIISIRKDTSYWENPLDAKVVADFFADQSSGKDFLFRMPGKLGNIIGDIERNTLMGILGAAKRGKSFWIQEMAIRALFEKLNVIYISLEMSSMKVKRRIYRRLTAQSDESRLYVYPAFDCALNQSNMCSKPERKNQRPLLIGGERPTCGISNFDSSIRYKICNICRNKKNSDYKAATWFVRAKRNKMEALPTIKFIEGVDMMMNDRFRFRAYPKFSANIQNILSDIEQLEAEEGFVPDVICVDYADILAPEDNRETGRDRIDRTWKMLGNMADVKHCLVVTASQSNRKSVEKTFLQQSDVSEDFRKIANVDMMLALNQLPEEKRKGVLRVAVIAGREGGFDEFKTVTVLEQREVGQVLLDSEVVIDNDEDYAEYTEGKKNKEFDRVEKFSDSDKPCYNRGRNSRKERKEGCV